MRSMDQGRTSGSLLAILTACAVLAGCGGGGGGSSQPPPSPPNADGDSVPDAQDCAPNDATKWQLLPYQSVDMDQDGHKIAAATSTATVCSGASLSAQYFNTAADPNDLDCDDASNARWQLLAYTAIDADGDGHFIASTGQACSGAALSSTYATTAPAAATVDCDDASASTWRLVMTYPDADGDGVGAGKGTVSCVGTTAQAGSSFLGYDPDPTNAAAKNMELSPWQLITP